MNRELAEGALIVDIRPAEQRTRDGCLPGAIVIDRNVLEWRLDPACEHHHAEVTGYDMRIVIVCNEGYQSSLAAALLQTIGLHRATDLIGGFQAWLSTLTSAPDAAPFREPPTMGSGAQSIMWIDWPVDGVNRGDHRPLATAPRLDVAPRQISQSANSLRATGASSRFKPIKN